MNLKEYGLAQKSIPRSRKARPKVPKGPMPHDRRNYGQACGLAKALDVVGERWTLLLVRDLMLGPMP